jgi:hypothetical protein
VEISAFRPIEARPAASIDPPDGYSPLATDLKLKGRCCVRPATICGGHLSISRADEAGRLTEKQRAVMEAIRELIIETGVTPTYREIQAKCGHRSVAMTYNYLVKLQRKGYVFLHNAPRGLVLRKAAGIPTCPVCGHPLGAGK